MARPSLVAACGLTLCGALAPIAARAQALTSITSLRVNYNTRKVLAKPTGELKAQLDSVDSQLAIAMQAGNSAQSRRLLAHGTTLLAGRAWTDSADYANSLLLRTEHVVVESQKPYVVRLEQLYALDACAGNVGFCPRNACQSRRRSRSAGRTRPGAWRVQRRHARSAHNAARDEFRRARSG